MESLNKAVNKDSILVAYLRGGVGSPMKSPGGDIFSRNYQRRSSGSSRSPLSPLENMKTPMVEEDEVLVMDGALVSPPVGSGSSSNSSSSSSGKSVYKKELRRAWEDLGHCRFASNRQFAHGKDEFHPSGFTIKNKELVHTCKSHATGPRSSPYVPKCRILPPAMTNAAVAAKQTAFSTIPEYTGIGPASHLKNPARIVPPQSPHLMNLAEPISLSGQTIATKSQLRALNLKTLERVSLPPSALTTGHHRMMALILLCHIRLTNAYQGKK